MEWSVVGEFSTAPTRVPHPFPRGRHRPNLPLTVVNVHRGLPHFPPRPAKRIVTTGTFDGVHLGHRALLDWMVDRARRKARSPSSSPFDPHPRQVLFGDDSGLPCSRPSTSALRSSPSTGLDHLVIQPFDRNFARLRPTDFVRDVLVEGLGCTSVVVGHDHRFGAGREGDVRPAARLRGHLRIRRGPHSRPHRGRTDRLQHQDPPTAHRRRLRWRPPPAGRPHAWSGRVVHGDARGRTLGFRTANLAPVGEPQQMHPGTGVYAVHVEGEHGHWKGMAHIGPRPHLRRGR